MNNYDKIKIFKNHFYADSGTVKIDKDGCIYAPYSSITSIGSMDHLSIKFSKVNRFNISGSGLKSLIGCPSYVTTDFVCKYNDITSLEHSPGHVGEFFDCSFNKLKSLKGCTPNIGGSFNCTGNELESLDGIPKSINGAFCITIYPNTPLLKMLNVVGVTSFRIYDPHVPTRRVLPTLFSEYYGKKNAVMKVGLELMKLGYGSNARL